MKIRTGHGFRRGTSTSVAVNSVAAAVAAVLAGTSGVARAQDANADNEPMEEVVVSGIRHSIETSIATKREAVSVVEVVSSPLDSATARSPHRRTRAPADQVTGTSRDSSCAVPSPLLRVESPVTLLEVGSADSPNQATPALS